MLQAFRRLWVPCEQVAIMTSPPATQQLFSGVRKPHRLTFGRLRGRFPTFAWWGQNAQGFHTWQRDIMACGLIQRCAHILHHTTIIRVVQGHIVDIIELIGSAKRKIRWPAGVSDWKVLLLFLFLACTCSFVLLLRIFAPSESMSPPGVLVFLLILLGLLVVLVVLVLV